MRVLKKYIVFNCILFICILSLQILIIHNQLTSTTNPLIPADNDIIKNPGLAVQASQATMLSKPDTIYPYKTIDKQKPIIVQYQFDNGLDCNGAYLKLMKSTDQFSASSSNNADNSQQQQQPYSVMFGVDKCGLDAKLHFVMQYLNPKTNQIEEKHWKSAQHIGMMQPTEIDRHENALIQQPSPSTSLFDPSKLLPGAYIEKSVSVQDATSGEVCPISPVMHLPAPSDSSRTDSKSYYQQQFLPNIESNTFPNILSAMRYYFKEVAALCILTGLIMNYALSLVKRKINQTMSSYQNGATRESNSPGLGLNSKNSLPFGPILHNDGTIQIGKITFDPKLQLGHGCRGTGVFKGTFESKQVCAVKRVLSQYVTLAGREIEFLRSLQNPNLVRYLATEEDAQFIYIALELAELTLADLIEGTRACTFKNIGITKQELCRQSANGLKYLHGMNIVHRDIKPQNILISFPLRPNNERKIMISDFGVSKQLASIDTHHTSSISRCLDGTQGWIAPEILKAELDKGRKLRPSKSADIFALGCVFWFIYSDGGHPFGDPFDRQTNILKDDFKPDLSDNFSQEHEALHGMFEPLVRSMIDQEVSQRPPIEAVLSYPLFWTKSLQLQFLLDVSDRIDKEQFNSPLVRRIDLPFVVDRDWHKKLDPDVIKDLSKSRSYNKNSVCHLLRAIRNKKNHYYELPPNLKGILGDIPDQYIDYFTYRFPKLLPHIYIATQLASQESVFKPYYSAIHRFLSQEGIGFSPQSNGTSNCVDSMDNDYFKWPDLHTPPWRTLN